MSHRRPHRARPAPAAAETSPEAAPAPAPPDVVAAAREQLDALYALLPPLACKGLCADSCHNPDASQLERDRIAEVHRVHLPEPLTRATIDAVGRAPRCPALSAIGTCTVYDVRPLMCRAWGTVITDPVEIHRGAMMCDHGCMPERFVPVAEYMQLLMHIERLSRLVTGVKRTPGHPREEHP